MLHKLHHGLLLLCVVCAIQWLWFGNHSARSDGLVIITLDCVVLDKRFEFKNQIKTFRNKRNKCCASRLRSGIKH